MKEISYEGIPYERALIEKRLKFQLDQVLKKEPFKSIRFDMTKMEGKMKDFKFTGKFYLPDNSEGIQAEFKFKNDILISAEYLQEEKDDSLTRMPFDPDFKRSRFLHKEIFPNNSYVTEVYEETNKATYKWKEKYGKKNGHYEEHRKDGTTVTAYYKDGNLDGVYQESIGKDVLIAKYYEKGKDVTEKHNALKRIEDQKQKRTQKLEDKKLPKAVKDIGKKGFEIDSKIQTAIAMKKFKKENDK